MDKKTSFPIFWPRLMLLLLLVVGVYFFYGFTVPVLAATIIAISTWPIYARLLNLFEYRRKITASIAIIIATIFIIVPLVFMTSYGLKEITVWLAWAIKANINGLDAPAWIGAFPYVGDWLKEQWDLHLSHPGMIGEVTQLFGAQNIGALYRNLIATSSRIFHVILTLTFMLITLFFLYKDGHFFLRQLDRVGEYFYPNRWGRYSRVVPIAVRSTVLGMGLIAIGEGIILGTAYWVAGVPSPVTLGIVTGFMAMIPGGAPLSFTMVSIYLIAMGSTMEGTLLFIWGCVELFAVDKFLRPRLVGRPMKLPFLPTFFGLIGGVKTMGFLGLFIGPALMAVLVMLWREFVQDIPHDQGDDQV